MKGVLASPLGALVGLLMGTFGGGGSLIAIPVLVYLVDQTPREAQATSLVIVMAASITGLTSHIRGGDVRWRMGIAFGLAAALSAFAGSLLNRELDADVLLLGFSPVMMLGAAAMLSDRAREPSRFTPWSSGVARSEILRVVALGLLVGWLIGLFGIGGGFIIVPVLVIVMHLGMVEAAGTSLLVVTIAASSALGDRLASGDVVWEVALPFSIAALAGALAGRRLAERVAAHKLQAAFASVIAVAALYTGISSAIDLWG